MHQLSYSGLLIGIISVVLQFQITLSMRLEKGYSLLEIIVYFFTFFTILTNTSLILTYLSTLNNSRWLNTFRKHEVRNMLAGFIFVVMMVYHFMLRKTWNPEGYAKWVDYGLHYLAPIHYLCWWLTLRRPNLTGYKSIFQFVPPMLAYVFWVFGRGYFESEYPYPFLDLNKLSLSQVSTTVLSLTLFFAAIMTLVTELDRRIFLHQGRENGSE